MTIKDILKRERITVPGLGQIEIRELTAKAQIEIADAFNTDDQVKAGFIACKYGVIDFANETIESIMEALPLGTVAEIAGHIYQLSGYTEDVEKNSVSGLPEGSSLDSPHILRSA